MSYKIDETSEVWKNIKGFEGLYQISSLGRVKCLRTKKILSTSISCGYERIHFYVNGGQTSRCIHRIVVETFIPNPENKPCVDHINTIRTDNRVENLRWVTYSENARNPITLKRISKWERTESLKQKISQSRKGFKHTDEAKNKMSQSHLGVVSRHKPILQTSKEGKIIREWFSVSEASRTLGISATSVSNNRFNNIYELFVHNVFYRSYDEFRNAVDGGMFEENHLDRKEYIEKQLNVKL